ncbi:MAG: glycosyltransferase [Dehalococcoidales bacterium]|nr:glycosyltransferase [Dehalococcoidales bacterium]
MNVLFVHEVDYLAKVVFDIHFLAEALSLRGHNVYAIDYENTWKRRSFFDFGSLETRRVDRVSRAFTGASVAVRHPGFIKIPGISRLSASFTHYREIGRTIREKSIDAVILYSVPTNGLQTIRLAHKAGIPVLFRSIDILNRLVPYAVLRPVTRLMEKKVYAGADMVIPNTPQYLKYVISMGAPESRVKLVPFPVDTTLFRPLPDTDELRQKWGLGKGPVIVFIGTLFKFSGMDAFIREFPRVLKAVPEARLLIVGDGPLCPELERIISALDMQKQVTITGFQPYADMPQYINLATVCINTFNVTDYTMDMFPAKIMQYVACGKATVATALRGIMTILPGESHGVVYVNNAAQMANEVTSLLTSDERRRKLESAGLDYIKENHSCDKIAIKLEEVLTAAIKEKQNGKT